jgi:hypothetical protein
MKLSPQLDMISFQHIFRLPTGFAPNPPSDVILTLVQPTRFENLSHSRGASNTSTGGTRALALPIRSTISALYFSYSRRCPFHARARVLCKLPAIFHGRRRASFKGWRSTREGAYTLSQPPLAIAPCVHFPARDKKTKRTRHVILGVAA